MSTIEVQSTRGIAAAPSAAGEPAPPTWLTRFDERLEKIGEWLNPILVKECRQALKSKQFVITFALVLLCAWLWSIAGIAILGPGVYYSFDGPEMFFGYYMILAFPLLVIVPYTAFRSLAGEREDRTFELLSITTLRPRQIVSGKLASAVVQMLVYLSAVSPCLTFTYMLRGIDVVSIVFILAYLFAGSLAFSLVALLLATVSRERHWQTVISLGVVVALCFAFFLSCIACYEVLRFSAFAIEERWFWLAHGAAATAYLSYFALFFCAAAAQLTFASDNRSTPLRICMLAQHALLAGWIALMVWEEQGEIQYMTIGVPMVIGISLATFHWSIMGMFLVGESPQLSPRIQRTLPKTSAGRALLSWFFPGPARGYVFVLANMAAAVGMALLGMLAWEAVYPPAPGLLRPVRFDQVVMLGVLCLGYVAFYLGLGKLVLAWLRNYSVVGALTSVLVHVILLLAGCGIPLVIHLMSDFRLSGYHLLHVGNPFWTIEEVVDAGGGRGGSIDAVSAVWIVAAVGLAMLVCNLWSILAEVRLVRAASPTRVAEEEAALAALHAPATQLPRSPWDEVE
ncbi:MAG: hypothetical protein WD894_25215 [Pirellulales bacterium]